MSIKDMLSETLPMAMMIAAPFALAIGVMFLIKMRSELAKSKSKSDVAIFTALGSTMMLCICACCFCAGYTGVRELKETKTYKAELEHKSKEYVIYVDGQEVSADKLNIDKYDKDSIGINDEKKEIYITTG